jgi:hypothetical protein
VPTPEPTPVPQVATPRWTLILSEVQPVWQQLMVTDRGSDFLRNLSLLAQDYLEISNANTVADRSAPAVRAN